MRASGRHFFIIDYNIGISDAPFDVRRRIHQERSVIFLQVMQVNLSKDRGLLNSALDSDSEGFTRLVVIINKRVMI